MREFLVRLFVSSTPASRVLLAVWSSTPFFVFVLAGHLHPVCHLSGPARDAMRLPCFVSEPGQGILPAFGAFTGGLNVLDPAIADLFAAPPLAAALGRDRVHALDWAILR